MPESRPKISLTSAPEITIGDINDITGTIADKDRFVLDTSGNRIDPATEGTLSSINGKIVKVDTDNVKVISEVAYDSANDLKKVSIQADGVGLATESTLSSINTKITKCDTDNVTIISLPSVTIGTDNVGLAKESTLSSINSKITKCDTDNVTVVSEVAYDSTNDWKKISIVNDAVGLATESTLSSIDSKITTCDTGNVTVTSLPAITIGIDNVGLAKDSTLNTLINNQNKVITQLASSVTVTAGSSVTYDHTIPDNHTGAVITIRVTYDASATAGATIKTYYSQDGTNFDTEAVDSVDLSFTAGATIQQSIIVAAPCNTLRIEVVNNDGSYDLTIDNLWIVTMP